MINPVVAISAIFILFVPKIIALGGVATGNIKAIEAETVAGSIRNNGLISIETDNPAKIGRIISVVAVFEVNSVRKVTSNAINKIIRNG